MKRPLDWGLFFLVASRSMPKPKVRRFFYVTTRVGGLLHRQFGTTHSEGRTACGIATRKGWKWADAKWRSRLENMPARFCERCERAA